MKLKFLTTLAAAGALVVTPVLAQAEGLSRQGAHVEDSEQIVPLLGIFLGILAVSAVVAGVVVVTEDDTPASP